MFPATSVTAWDMYNTLMSPEQDDTVCVTEIQTAEYPEAVVDTSRAAERSVSVGSTVSTGNSEAHWRDRSALV